mgnify:CR=1 FL=1
MSDKLTRRDFLRLGALTAAGAALAGCATPTPQVVRETVEVPQTVEVPVKETVVVQPTEPPATVPPAPEPANLVIAVGTGEFSDEALETFLGQAKLVAGVERLEPDATRLRAMFAAATPPDIWCGSGADVPEVVRLGWPLDLTEFFQISQVLKPDDMQPAVGYFQYRGGWYGMHKDFSCDMQLQINAAAFEEAGLPVPEPKKLYTYQDAAEWARALTKKEGERTLRIGWADNEWWDGILQNVLAENEEELFVDDFTRANIKDNQTVRDVLAFYAQLARENVIWNPLNPSPSWPGDDYVTGRAAMIRYGYWMHGIVVGTAPEDLAAPIEKFVMLPGLSWGGKKIVDPPMGGAGWFIARATQAPLAAWELFEYYMGGPPAEERARSGWGLPALKSLMPLVPQETEFDKQWYEAVVWELENTVQKPRQLNPFISTGNINSAWQTNFELYLKGDITLDEAIDNTDKEVNTALRERISALG